MNARLSQRSLAARIPFTRQLLSMVEIGEREVTLQFAEACDKALNADGALIRMARENMERRGILMSAASIPFLAATDLVYKGMSAALSEHHECSLEEWVERSEAYGRDYMIQGPAEIRARIVADLGTIQHQIRISPHMSGVASKLLTMVGKTTSVTDPGASPSEWYALAATAADRSKDAHNRVWVRGRAALALAYEAQAVEMAELFADQALAISDRPSIGRLNALVAKAQMAGQRGDHRDALAYWGQARRLYDIVGSDDSASEYNVPLWRFHVFGSVLLSRMGDRRAIPLQDEADNVRPPEAQRFATHIELHRGLYLAKTGDVATGVEYASIAFERLPEQKRSYTLRRMMKEVQHVAKGRAA